MDRLNEARFYRNSIEPEENNDGLKLLATSIRSYHREGISINEAPFLEDSSRYVLLGFLATLKANQVEPDQSLRHLYFVRKRLSLHQDIRPLTVPGWRVKRNSIFKLRAGSGEMIHEWMIVTPEAKLLSSDEHIIAISKNEKIEPKRPIESYTFSSVVIEQDVINNLARHNLDWVEPQF